jgi:Bifunctional DNA primase/polymerase, N-terminal
MTSHTHPLDHLDEAVYARKVPPGAPGGTFTPEMTRSNLEAALRLAAAGLPIFPALVAWNPIARKNDKRPAITGWQSLASDDEETIRTWWTTYPTALVGLELGRAGLVVVDCDRHPNAPDGVQAFRALCAGRPLPNMPIIRTASNGLHLIFANSRGLTNARGALPPGIDIRAKGGWIVAPGSTCPTGAWRAVPGRSMVTSPIPTMPDWLVQIITARPEPKVRANGGQSFAAAGSTGDHPWWLRGLVSRVVNATPGVDRNHMLFWAAACAGEHLREGRGTEGEVVSALLGAATANGMVRDDGGPDYAMKTINSAFKRVGWK